MNVSSTKPSLLLTLSPHPLPLQGFYQPSGKKKNLNLFRNKPTKAVHLNWSSGVKKATRTRGPVCTRVALESTCGSGVMVHLQMAGLIENLFSLSSHHANRKEEVGPDPEIHFHPPSLSVLCHRHPLLSLSSTAFPLNFF